MKQILAIILLMSISYQFVAKMGITVWYEVNKDYISAELCENKDKPELQCNGKCYLNKQIAKVDNTERSKGEKQLPKKTETELHVFYSTAQVQLDFSIFSNSSNYYDNYIPPRGITHLSSVFHPPQTLV